MADWITLLPFLAAVFAVAMSGAVFMPGDWYKSLRKPSWTPPDWLFGPAWTLLYLLIAIAGWLVWREVGLGLTLGIWGLNLVLNAAWSWLMFGRHQIRAALMDAIGMLTTIVAFIWAAWPVSPTAAALFVPYLAWTAFATALNWAILQRNPQAVT
jgi:tryptophan-rich sensory protein